MNKKRIETLIEKYLNGVCSYEEKEWVEKWLEARSMKNSWNWEDENHRKAVEREMFENLDHRINYIKPKLYTWRSGSFRFAAAAFLIVGLAFGFWFFAGNKAENELQIAGKAVQPGSRVAVLQMGDGEIVYLDDQKAGILSQLEGVEISKTIGGGIEYNIVGNNETGSAISSDKIKENSLFVPRGGQYKITLPDGNNFWLNSETKLTYPTRFAGKERKVKLVGEAYFEVARNVNQPFIVESDGMDIKVLGTEFNVSAYEGAFETLTTLVEGSVEVNSGKENMKIVPGQQAYKNVNKAEIEMRKVNVNNIVSWKRGYFSFDYQNLDEVMEDIARWYDIEYSFVGKVKKQEKLGGTFSRNKSLDELLMYLEQLIDVKAKRDGRRVTLMY